MDNDPSITIRFEEPEGGGGGPAAAASTWAPANRWGGVGTVPYGPSSIPFSVPPPRSQFQGQNIFGGYGADPYGPPSPYGPPRPPIPPPQPPPPPPIFGRSPGVPFGSSPVPPPSYPGAAPAPNPWGTANQPPPPPPPKPGMSPTAAWGVAGQPDDPAVKAGLAGRAFARMVMEQHTAPALDESWAATGSLKALNQAVILSKMAKAMTPSEVREAEGTSGADDDDDSGDGKKSNRPGIGKLGSMLQKGGDFLKRHYMFMPRGFEMLTLRAGAMMSNVGSGMVTGTLSSTLMVGGAAAAGVGAGVVGFNVAMNQINSLISKGIAPMATEFLHMVPILRKFGETFTVVSDRFEREAQSYREFSGNVAGAYGHREFTERAGMIERAQRLGPQLADQVRSRTYLNEAVANMEGAGTKLLLDRLGPLMEKVNITLEGMAVKIEHGIMIINSLMGKAEGLLEAVPELVVDLIPFVGDAKKFMGEMEQAALEARRMGAEGSNLQLDKLFGNFDPIDVDPNVQNNQPQQPQAPAAAPQAAQRGVDFLRQAQTGILLMGPAGIGMAAGNAVKNIIIDAVTD